MASLPSQGESPRQRVLAQADRVTKPAAESPTQGRSEYVMTAMLDDRHAGVLLDQDTLADTFTGHPRRPMSRRLAGACALDSRSRGVPQPARREPVSITCSSNRVRRRFMVRPLSVVTDTLGHEGDFADPQLGCAFSWLVLGRDVLVQVEEVARVVLTLR
jgi:hypothetical protein